MPTGYTSDISKGITFKEFVLTCARAFGALIDVRDGEEIPDEIKPSDHHIKALEEAQNMKTILGNLTANQIEISSNTQMTNVAVNLQEVSNGIIDDRWSHVVWFNN